MFAPDTRASTGVLEHGLEIAAGNSQPWKDAKDHRRYDCNQNRPAERLEVNMHGAQ